MPTSIVYLDDDHNIVPPDQATITVESETDDQGRLVEERWGRFVRPGSDEEEMVEIVRESERLASGMAGTKPGRSPAVRPWMIAAIVIFVAVVLWLLLR